jgi:hypothetical protein
MSLTLTPLQSDNFQRANVSPLTSPWATDEDNDVGFQIVSQICEPQLQSDWCGMFYTYASTPNDQYCSATLAAALGTSSFLDLKVRATDNHSVFVDIPGYRFHIAAAGTWDVYVDTASSHAVLLSGSGLTISAGDVYTIASVGSTIYAFQNSVLLGSASDSTYASGQVMLGGEGSASTSGLQISSFVMGSAAVASGGSNLPFLGTACEGSAPSNIPNPPYLGTFKVIGSAPNAAAVGTPTNPFLGTFAVVAGPSGSQNNPVLGEIVVIGSAGSFPNRFLGNAAVE